MRVVFPLAVDDMAPEAVVYQRITVEANLIVCHLQQVRALFTTLQRTIVRGISVFKTRRKNMKFLLQSPTVNIQIQLKIHDSRSLIGQ